MGKGDLTMNVDSIEVTCQDIRFGQGHNGRNNWWVGGPNCAGGNSGGNPVTCACNDGALITFQTGDVNRFSVSLENRCAIISERRGSWVAATAAPGQKIGYSFSSSSTEYKETDFMASLSAQFSPVFEFGSLEMSAEASYKYITQNTDSSSWSKTCDVTVPEGQRLWQWTYTLETNCGANAVHSCYFFTLPIDVGQPCCLAGFQSSVYNQCTEPGKNMCGEESADVEASSQENVTGPRRLRGRWCMRGSGSCEFSGARGSFSCTCFFVRLGRMSSTSVRTGVRMNPKCARSCVLTVPVQQHARVRMEQAAMSRCSACRLKSGSTSDSIDIRS